MEQEEMMWRVGRARRWWIRCKETPRILTVENGWYCYSSIITFYVPWWAWQFELLDRVIFGRYKINK